ncbi:uncharacterized protein DS421_18g625770 [Arachis hypogaea]|nr:uncharacterized protein DS421_18g625770 [Arachis hypogaea]
MKHAHETDIFFASPCWTEITYMYIYFVLFSFLFSLSHHHLSIIINKGKCLD